MQRGGETGRTRRSTAFAATRAMACVAALWLAACNTAPVYRVPEAPTPAAWKEAPVAGAVWLPAAPADALDRGPWWALFGDADLDRLASQIDISNQNVATAVASYAQARALVREQRAALFPSLGVTATARRDGGAGAVAGNSLQATLGATWEPDLWGRLGNSVTAARANAQASAADLASARLSAQAELATNYFSLREADAELALLRTAVTAYDRALQIAGNRYAVGVIAKTDVLQAQTLLANTRASLAALAGTRARLEHAIAVLIGKPPGAVAIAVTPWNDGVPAVPTGLPSLLLQRRPDIAAAERAVAAANANIGIERSAYFPSLALSASYGVVGSSFGGLFGAAATLWSLGVSAAQTLFDAGARSARVAGAEAFRDAAVARYRQTVLTAFQAVEDQLASLRSLAAQEALVREASVAADATETQILNRYREGQLNYTDVVTAQITALNARRALLLIGLSRQAGAIALIQALGGGWQARELDAP